MEIENISVNMKEGYESRDAIADLQEIYSLRMEGGNHAKIEQQNDYNEDLYNQLLQKENDLQLAAELGKALLDSKEELEQKYEQQQEDFAAKIEEATQQKYDLKYRLESVQGEFDTTVKELQNDITQYQRELEKHKQQSSTNDKNRSQMVQDLTQQNERLTEQIKKYKTSEEHLDGQVQSLRQQLHARRTSMTEHTHHLHVLREEVNLLSDQKNDLERKTFNLAAERDTLSSNQEEAQDRIMMLERQMLEQDQRIRQQDREISQLQEQNSNLSTRVDELPIFKDISGMMNESNENSLLNELTGISPSTSTPQSSPGHARNQHSSPCHTPRPHLLSPPGGSLPYGVGHHHPGAGLWGEEDGIECDDDDDDDGDLALSSSPGSHGNRGGGHHGYPGISDSLTMQALASLWGPQRDTDAKIATMELKHELLEVYRAIQGVVNEMKGEPWDPQTIQLEHVRVTTVLQVITDLRELIDEVISNNSPGERKLTGELEEKVEALTLELSQSESNLDKAKTEVKLKEQELKRQVKELDELAEKIKISLQHDEMAVLREERDRLQDQAMGMSPTEVLEQTRQERDEFIEKKNKLECDLVKARLDNASLDAQLMDAVKQKLELSQQLELWQVDMTELIGSTVVTRLQQEKKPAAEKHPSPQPQKRKLKFSFPWN